MHSQLRTPWLSLILLAAACDVSYTAIDTADSSEYSSSSSSGTITTTTTDTASGSSTTQVVTVTTTTTPPTLVDLRINEVQSSNMNGITDESGDTSDWIELRNFSSKPIDLTGIGLTDDADRPYRFVFTGGTLGPGEVVLVMANGTESTAWSSLDTVVDFGAVFSFATVNMATNSWYVMDNDDSLWPSGPSPFGYGDGDDATVVNGSAVFGRVWFDVDATSLANSVGARLHMDYDDSFIAYLNGVEIARANIGTVGNPANPSDFASAAHEALLYQGLPLEFFDVEDIQSLLLEGPNLLAVEAHNVTQSSSDMTMMPMLSIGLSTTDGVAGALIGASSLAAEFKLDAHGETITLTDSAGYTLDQMETGRLYADESLGLSPNTGESLWFQDTTPGAQNETIGYAERLETPQISPDGGLASAGMTFEITAGKGSLITYTLDGSEPTESSSAYKGPEVIAGGQDAVVLRARAFKVGAWPSPISTITWFTDGMNLPTWSIVTDPENLWSSSTGIYYSSNVWNNWERPVHLEFYETDGTLVLNTDAGIKIHGGASRDFAQKSLRLLARSGYGDSEFAYSFFPDTEVDTFKRLILRNGSHDWCLTMVRDPVTHALVRDQDVDIQGYRPSRAFINGEYWGIYNIREKQDKHYIASHHEEDPEALDILEYDGYDVNEGDNQHYIEFLAYAEQNDLSDPIHYAWIADRMDVSEFIEYVIIETFVSNYDWPGNNIQFWRPRREGGVWRWTLYDTESGYANWGISSNYDMINHILNDVGAAWPNGAWSTLLFRSLLDSDAFLNEFVNRYSEALSTRFLPTETVSQFDEYLAVVTPEIPFHQFRWGGSMSTHYYEVGLVRDFLEVRDASVWTHLRNNLPIGSAVDFSLTVDPPEYGDVQLTGMVVTDVYSGRYFSDMPVTLTALPIDGAHLVGWSDLSLGDSEVVSISVVDTPNLTAVFALDDADVTEIE